VVFDALRGIKLVSQLFAPLMMVSHKPSCSVTSLPAGGPAARGSRAPRAEPAQAAGGQGKGRQVLRELQPACSISSLEETAILNASLRQLPALACEYTPSCCLSLPAPSLPVMEGTHCSAREARTRAPWPGLQLCTVQMGGCWFER